MGNCVQPFEQVSFNSEIMRAAANRVQTVFFEGGPRVADETFAWSKNSGNEYGETVGSGAAAGQGVRLIGHFKRLLHSLGTTTT